MKDIKDYLHLYLGCEAEWRDERYPDELKVIGELIEVGNNMATINKNWEYHECMPYEVKPILRPLSSMTDDEAKEMTQVMYDSIYGSGNLFIDSNYCNEDIPDKAGFVFKDETGDRIGVTFEERGVEFSANGTKLIIPQFEIVKILLSKHFDLFGLIDAGLAIAK